MKNRSIETEQKQCWKIASRVREYFLVYRTEEWSSHGSSVANNVNPKIWNLFI